jgi:hypothetical protein
MDESPDLPRPSLAPTVRIGDAERERAAAALSDHYAAGRIDHHELDLRLDAVYAATTAPELNRWFSDLPGPVPVPPPAPPAPPALPRRAGRAVVDRRFVVVPLVVALVVVVGVSLATSGRFVPGFLFIPLMWVWFGGRRFGRTWHHSGRM